MSVGSLIPVRFLTLTAHLVITIVIFWSKAGASHANASDINLMRQAASSLQQTCCNLCVSGCDTNLLECLPLSYSQTEYDDKDTTLVIGLSLMLAFLAIELLSFLGGVSMFNASASMFSIAAHGIGAISLAFFIFDAWDCDRFWYIFGFCSAFPVLIEIIVMIAVLGLKRGM